ncbi:MAG: hypothetical protein LKJ69_04990 [Lactobacillus sp.]|nr:hypothetical protein [Lactobacillus sp.]MCI2032740.1 hypothetical protein [Lactobacillus sp.]
MTKANIQLRTRRRTLLIMQAVLWAIMAIQPALLRMENAAATRQLGDLSSQGAGWAIIFGGWTFWLPTLITLPLVFGLAIAVAVVRLLLLPAATSTTQRWWLWGLWLLGGVMNLTAMMALFWGFVANTLIAWRVSAWACAADFICTVVAREIAVGSEEDAS